MKKVSEENPLLEAVLNDEAWRAASAECQGKALEQLRHRRRERKLIALSTTVAIVVVLGFLTNALRRTGEMPAPMTARQAPAIPRAPAEIKSLTDEQLLSLFPKGSCILAEVDGKTELVFLDREAEREFLARPSNVLH